MECVHIYTVFLVKKNALITEFTSRGNNQTQEKIWNSFKIRQQIYHIEKSLAVSFFLF